MKRKNEGELCCILGQGTMNCRIVECLYRKQECVESALLLFSENLDTVGGSQPAVNLNI